MTNMTDETRAEIVRLARKGWSAEQISDELTIAARLADEPTIPVTEEQVQQVIDEADREVERMLTPTVPEQTLDQDVLWGRVRRALEQCDPDPLTKWVMDQVGDDRLAIEALERAAGLRD